MIEKVQTSEDPRPGTAARHAAWDRAWKGYTGFANQAFESGDFRGAGRLYLCALQEAEAHFDAARAGGAQPAADVAPMLVVSAANAAENYRRQDRPQDSFAVLCRLVLRLTDAMNDAAAPEALRQAGLLHMERALGELNRWHSADRLHQRAADRLSEDARAAAVAFLKSQTTEH